MKDRCLKIIIILLLSSLLLPPATMAGSTSVAREYEASKKIYRQLKACKKPRREWLRLADRFRKVYRKSRDTEQGPSSLFMLGRVYHDMFRRFKNPLDLGESVAYYEDIITFYSDNRLADDALFAIGSIYLNDKKDPDSAMRRFAQVISLYPEGDMAPAAAGQIEKLRGRSRPENGSKTAVAIEPAKMKVKKGDAALAVLHPLRYWSTRNYTRVVIETDRKVRYRDKMLPRTGSKPRRLFVDLMGCRLPPDFNDVVPIDDGLLRRARSGQFDRETVRVVLDAVSISDYKIFSLDDPFRVVIDVKGEKKNSGDRNFARTAAANEDPDSLSLLRQLGLGVRKIVIDPGHGGRDPGARSKDGLLEKDITLKVAKRLAAQLTEELGCKVVLTRDRDVFVPLEERTAIANTTGGDLFISIHVNAAPTKRARGIETYILDLARTKESMQVAARENASTTKQMSDLQTILMDLMQHTKVNESVKLAEYVQESMIRGLSRKYRKVVDLGVKRAPFIVLIGAEMPAILAEISFISNPTEAKRLRNKAYLNDVSRQLTAGISRYVNDLNLAGLRQ